MCFPLGIWYGYFMEKIEAVLRKQMLYWITAISMILMFGTIYLYHTGVAYIIVSALFAFVVTLVTMKVNIGNPILKFLGRHVFSIYILQRIPFMVLKNFIGNVYLYFVFSLIITLIIAVLYDMSFERVKSMVVAHFKE